MSKVLLAAAPESAITIWDCTYIYIYIERSANYKFQKDTCSLHKHRNILKFMILCSTDGFIVDVIWAYVCNEENNDSSITLDVFRNNINDIENYFRKLDLFVVNRGFRDLITYLETK